MSTKSFNHDIPAYNTQSASVILPFLTGQFPIRSIVDIGCGIGTWLAIAREKGIEDVIGVDGAYVKKELLHISPDLFMEHDLSGPFDLGRKFDIAFCLEVAEHIDDARADHLIDSIVRHADLVLFSAAVPGQTGDGHINEQWVDHWVKKFAARDYLFYDLVRPVFWNHPAVEWWYKQNMFIVARKGHLAFPPAENINQYIHPDLYKRYVNDLDKYQSGKISALQGIKTFVKSLIRS